MTKKTKPGMPTVTGKSRRRPEEPPVPHVPRPKKRRTR